VRVRFAFDYGTKLEPEVADRLAGVLDKPVEFNPPDASYDPGALKTHVEYEGDLEQVLGILGRSASIKVHGMGAPAPLQDLRVAVEALMRRMDAFTSAPARATEEYVNTKVDVHVPGNALLEVDEILVHLDLCTEALQDELEKGWRIVAVCPQPNQRRPDYVLGRRKPAPLPSPPDDSPLPDF
jgi:hypothetical protein